MLYARAIVDELGDVIAWCRDLKESEIEEILDRYPESSIRCIAQ